MTKAESDLEMIRLRMEFGTWLRQRSDIRLTSGMGEFMFNRWIKGRIVVLDSNKPWVSVTFHD